MASFKIKKSGVVVLVVLACVAAFFVVKTFVLDAPKEVGESQVVADLKLEDITQSTKSLPSDKELALPNETTTSKSGLTEVDWVVIPWNSQMGLMYANGGPVTTSGSLFEKYGVKVNIRRQDDCFKTMSEFIANADQLSKGETSKPMIVSVMGDGMPGFSTMLKMPAGDKPVIFYTMGRSNGEDQFMGPAEWAVNPKACLGKTVAGVRLDGDMNIVLKWAADNDIRVNVDEQTYDSTALNVIYPTDFMDAVAKFKAGYTETKKVKSKGKTTGQIVTVGIDAVTTWTPGDVEAYEVSKQINKPLVTLASTADYTGQMPNASFISNNWAKNHADVVVNIIKALGEAGDQVRSFPRALLFAGDVSAKVYNDKNGEYWVKYYRGVEINNALKLGGSTVFNLADAANVFGLGSDGIDRYRVTYEGFGNILKKLYPKDMGTFTAYDDIVDKSYLRTALSQATNVGTVAKQTYTTGDITREVSSKIYKIQFANNSDVITPESLSEIRDAYNSAVVAEGLSVVVHGHANQTAGTSDEYNQDLSDRRAKAVANALIGLGLTPERVKSAGYGANKPLQGTLPSDVQNRRVEIVLGR